MILDTSVLLAIIQREPGWEGQQRRLEEAPLLRISAGTLQELLVVAHCRAVLEPVEALLELLDPDVVAVDADLALYQRFGKGLGHAAQLNFGDCFAAALAEREQLPLADAGGDCAAVGF
jgi:ribonuclease VapC